MFNFSASSFSDTLRSLNAPFQAYAEAVYESQVELGHKVRAAVVEGSTVFSKRMTRVEATEAVITAQEMLHSALFDALRDQVKLGVQFARGQYGSLVQVKVLPNSMLQSAKVEGALQAKENVALSAVDATEAVSLQVAEPVKSVARTTRKAATPALPALAA